MPELAEVDFFRRRWNPGLGDPIEAVAAHRTKRVFRDTRVRDLLRWLPGQTLRTSESHGKQMVFRFSGGSWLGVHLGMTGSLRVESASWNPQPHDHLVLRQSARSLVFRDPRLFGRILFQRAGVPGWWTDLPVEILSADFTADHLCGALTARRNAVIKAVLLDQRLFPGVGNWMADEILWRAEVHPARRVGSLAPQELRSIWKQTRFVARRAMEVIAPDWGDLPRGWLFHHRWSDGGACPRTGAALVRETIAGRTTCWSPGRQGSS